MVRVFHESVGKDLVVAEEQLVSGSLLVKSAEHGVNLILPLSSLQIEKGGANNQLFLLTSSLYPGWTIYVRDYDLIKVIKAEAPHLKAPRKNLIDSGFSLAVLATLVIIGLFFGLFLLKDPVMKWAVSQFPKEYEVYIGKTLINQAVGADSGRYEEARKMVDELLTPLKEIAKEEGYELKIYINNDESLNAFALPGGFIAFNLGFLRAVESAEEILGVGGHELAHVTKRHSLNQLMQTLGTFVVLQVFLGDITGIAGVLVDNSQFLLSRMYSRESEEEADKVGLDYVYSKGVSGRGLLTFIEKIRAEMAKLTKDQPEALKAFLANASFLSTHPAPDERIEYLKQEIEKREMEFKGKIQLVEFDLAKLKSIVGDANKEEAKTDKEEDKELETKSKKEAS